MIPVNVTDIINWKYEGQARFTYQGDGVQIKKHTNGDDECSGLTWLDDNINKPTKAQIDSWRADAEEAYKWDDVRVERDSLLAKSDYVMMVDYPIHEVGRTEWESYRQELRDIPESFASADLVEFPNEPS
jgi:hypothetical protein|tara:strand:+ start:521 stop:910 length:390 start_codon:yes stop_codon:yes gene_type:complete